MAIKKIVSNINVLEASKIRIKNLFNTGVKVYMAFSSGKDSLCMSNIVYDLIKMGEINPKQLTVIFIDEEGLYTSMVDAAIRWRKKFLSVGADFQWYCLPFKQVSVIDHLSASESWITWESSKRDVWMREPPPYAIMSSPYMEYEGQYNYQTFCNIAFKDGIRMIGLRTAESLTRLKSIARTDMSQIRSGGVFYPIYDWSNNDVWYYIKENNLEFPEIYMRLYEAGVTKNNLRLCAFFGDCGTQGLRWIAETDHELWDKIQKREPNAYLVLLYWDSEMFKRSTKNRREMEKDEKPKIEDYRKACGDLLFLHTDQYFIAEDTAKHLGAWRSLYTNTYGIAQEKHYQTMYEAILYGDPKARSLRSLWTSIFNDYNMEDRRKKNDVRN